MTLQEIKLLLAYNAWANERLFNELARLPADDYRRDMKASHGSIHGTCTHIVGAQKMWLSRWRGSPEPVLLKGDDIGGLAELRTIWEAVGHDTAKFVGSMTDKTLQDAFTMKTSSGKLFTHTYWQALQHMVDHSTYHRGQIVVMLRQLGVKPPATGLIVFYREAGG